VREFTKTFEKVPASRRKHGGKVYEYGYVWVVLPPECIGKTAVVKVYVLEEFERPPQPQPAQPATPTRPQPKPQPQVSPAQPALPRPQPQPTQPRPLPARPQPPAQPQAPLLPPHRILSEPLPPLQPPQPSLSPELASLLTLRSRPEQPQLRDLLPFEEFTLGEEEKEEEKRKRGLFRWP
jgi:hypothetical protein